MVFSHSLLETSFSLTYVVGIAGVTLDLIDYPTSAHGGHFVLGVYQHAPNGVVRFKMDTDPSLAHQPGDVVRQVANVWEGYTAFDFGSTGVTGHCGCLGGGSCDP